MLLSSTSLREEMRQTLSPAPEESADAESWWRSSEIGEQVKSTMLPYASIAYRNGRTIKLCNLAKQLHEGECAERELENRFPAFFSDIKKFISLRTALECAIDEAKIEIKARLAQRQGTPEKGGSDGQQQLYDRALLRKYLKNRLNRDEGSQAHRLRVENYSVFGLDDILDGLFTPYCAAESARASFSRHISRAQLTEAFSLIEKASKAQAARTVAGKCAWIEEAELLRLKKIYELGREPEERTRAINEMVETNTPLVLFHLKRFGVAPHNPDFEDLMQSGMCALWKAAEDFDVELGYQFSSCASKYISNELKRAFARIKRYGAFSLDACPEGDDLSYAARVEDRGRSPLEDCMAEEGREILTLLNEKLCGVSERQRDILERRFGLVNGSPETLAAIGAEYDLSKERIRQLEGEALSELAELLSEGTEELLKEAVEVLERRPSYSAERQEQKFRKHRAKEGEEPSLPGAMRSYSRPKRNPVQLPRFTRIQKKVSSPAEATPLAEILSAADVFSCLPSNLRTVAEMMSTLQPEGPRGADEVARECGVSKATVFRVRNKARELLAKNLSPAQLDALFKVSRKTDVERSKESFAPEVLERIQHQVEEKISLLGDPSDYILRRRLGLKYDHATLEELAAELSSNMETIRETVKQAMLVISRDDPEFRENLTMLLFPRKKAA